MSKRKQARSRRVELFVELDADGGATIDRRETLRRTKEMIGFDKGLDPRSIFVDDNLSDDLNYDSDDKIGLKPLIDNRFFADVNAKADASDLPKATTVGNLRERIYDKYIPEGNRS